MTQFLRLQKMWYEIAERKRILFIVLVGAFLLLIFWSNKETLEDFLLFKITKNETFEQPNLKKYYINLRPFRIWQVEDLEIKAKAAVSVEVAKTGQKKFLFKKNARKTLPIASLTKLMTALIVLENYDLDQTVVISEKAATIEGDINNLRVGERFYVKDLLYSLLMESNNATAQALAEIMGEKEFVKLMNLKAKEMNLKNTYFSNPTGLDPDDPKVVPNYSSAEDLTTLAFHLLKKPLIWEISRTKEFELYETNGVFHHKIENNNELLGTDLKIFGGKTGWTPMAGGCLLLILENPKNDTLLINVILGSENRFEEMKKMIDWVYRAYLW